MTAMTVNWGPVFWLLLVIAASSIVIFFERLFEIRRSQIDWQDFVGGIINILSRGNDDEALAICEDTAVPVANVVATAIRQRKGSAQVLREAVDSQGRTEVGRLDRRLASLAILGQISPALGLLGTVIGFIKAVLLVDANEIVVRADLMSAAMDSLVTAALGLAVAIMVAVMYGMLRIRMERLVIDLEAAASSIVGYISTAAVSEPRR